MYTKSELYSVGSITGKEIPSEAYIQLAGQPIKMKKKENQLFEYSLINVQKSQIFKFSAGGLYSETYQLNVLPAPSLVSFELSVDYPPYIGKENKRLENTGEVLIPEGSKVRWDFFTENTDTFNVLWGEKLLHTKKTSKNHFSFFRTANISKLHLTPHLIQMFKHLILLIITLRL